MSKKTKLKEDTCISSNENSKTSVFDILPIPIISDKILLKIVEDKLSTIYLGVLLDDLENVRSTIKRAWTTFFNYYISLHPTGEVYDFNYSEEPKIAYLYVKAVNLLLDDDLGDVEEYFDKLNHIIQNSLKLPTANIQDEFKFRLGDNKAKLDLNKEIQEKISKTKNTCLTFIETQKEIETYSNISTETSTVMGFMKIQHDIEQDKYNTTHNDNAVELVDFDADAN